jgi:hypothetical protein
MIFLQRRGTMNALGLSLIASQHERFDRIRENQEEWGSSFNKIPYQTLPSVLAPQLGLKSPIVDAAATS